jgi:exonuclease III
MLVKIFSYNIHGLPYISDSWCEPLAEWFTDTDYDFICLQEVFTQKRIDILTKSLNKNGYTVLKPNDFKERRNLLSSGLITAIKNNTWDIISDIFIAYNDSVGAELLANKGFHIVTVKHKKKNETIILINTHMQSDNPTTYFAGCLDTRPIRRNQAQQIYEYLNKTPKYRHFLVGDLNSEKEAHDEFLYLTGQKNGIMKHTFPSTGEDLDHVAILPKFWNSIAKPIIKEISVLSKLNWSDHWPIHIVIYVK